MQPSDISGFQKDTSVATLLTASATTGWLDWIHGELWLFPHGLLRIPLDFTTTYLHGAGPTVNRMRRPQRSFDHTVLQTLLTSPKNVWVPRESIQKAYLHHGITCDRLRLVVGDHYSVKFLWFPWDGARQLLQPTLAEWLGSGLIID
ncbi:hypothetical protein [Tengunoibacter tsumagoiensis]|uniref:Uncharacterized protein n=1 Tax=Tengunoibacter tsumagoiensis TaxID=2014871 RepID=A0A402A5Y1_9CHLR|nr:hypothetical protein [Tengunoibacter tsumagoiensis]GCE14554.1 hypothetical protein KTT_44130 [Tengunoibacter tsumagoiensis]